MKRSAVEAPAEEQAGRPGLIRLTPGWEGPFAGQRGGGQSRWVQMLSTWPSGSIRVNPTFVNWGCVEKKRIKISFLLYGR